MNDLPVIELYEAGPLARGRAYGEAARDRIAYNPDFYKRVFMNATGEAWADIQSASTAALIPKRRTRW